MTCPKGRFAPSPSGRMHLGNVYCALLSYLLAKKAGGTWLLRIEDLDRQRCRREYAELLLEDLRWLGLVPDEGARSMGDASYFQSERDALYEDAFARLESQGLLYDCFCRRADLLASSAPQSDGRNDRPSHFPSTRFPGIAVYSGRCRNLSAGENAGLLKTRLPAKRIRTDGDTGAVEITFTDGHYGEQACNLPCDLGDFVIRRADGNFAYQLAVVVDDALMGVTDVVRGRDLLPSTFQQLFLYRTLGLTPPRFTHLPLLVTADGRRLSKRDRDTDMAFFRANLTPEQLIGKILFLSGQIPREEPVSLAEAIVLFDSEKIPREDIII